MEIRRPVWGPAVQSFWMREEDEVNHVVATRMKTYGEVQDTFGGQVYGIYLMNYICVCAWTRDQDASQVSV